MAWNFAKNNIFLLKILDYGCAISTLFWISSV